MMMLHESKAKPRENARRAKTRVIYYDTVGVWKPIDTRTLRKPLELTVLDRTVAAVGPDA